MTIDQAKKEKIDAFLAEPILARLATANPKNCQPHAVPVWFLWDGESIFISAFSSTRKVKDLKKNQRCSICIDTQESGKPLTGVVLEGTAELFNSPGGFVTEMSLRIYEKYMGEEGVKAADPQSWAIDPENHIIKLTPEHIYSW